MNITEVTFRLSLTQTLPDYCNIKPSMSLTAQIDKDEDWTEVNDYLKAQIETYLQEYVNQALEAEGKAARYYEGPTYQIMRNHHAKIVIVIPDSGDWPEGFSHYIGGDSCEHRLPFALKEAQRKATELEWEFIDISDGDLSKLPPRPEPELGVLSEDDISF